MKSFVIPFTAVAAIAAPATTFAQTTPSENLLGASVSVAGLLALCLAGVLVLAWIILPFLLLGALRNTQREVSRLRNDLSATQKETSKILIDLAKAIEKFSIDGELTRAHLHNIDAEAQHTNQLLQWIGDQEKNRAKLQEHELVG